MFAVLCGLLDYFLVILLELLDLKKLQIFNILLFLDFVKLYLLQQLRYQNVIQYLIEKLPSIYRCCQEKNNEKIPAVLKSLKK